MRLYVWVCSCGAKGRRPTLRWHANKLADDHRWGRNFHYAFDHEVSVVAAPTTEERGEDR